MSCPVSGLYCGSLAVTNSSADRPSMFCKIEYIQYMGSFYEFVLGSLDPGRRAFEPDPLPMYSAEPDFSTNEQTGEVAQFGFLFCSFWGAYSTHPPPFAYISFSG